MANYDGALVSLRSFAHASEHLGMEELVDFAICLIVGQGDRIPDRLEAAKAIETLLRLGGSYEQIEAVVRELAGAPEAPPLV